MNIESQVSSLGPSKRLKELGVRQESLFYHCCRIGEGNIQLDYAIGLTKFGNEYYSAFTVAELCEMLPENLPSTLTLLDGPPDEFLKKYYYLSIGRVDGVYLINYRKIYMHAVDILHTVGDKKLSDSCAKMLIYLLENNLMEFPK